MPLVGRVARAGAVGAAIAVLVGLVPSLPASATPRSDGIELKVLALINQGRGADSKGAEVMHAGLRTESRSHSVYQSSHGMSHDNLTSRVKGAAPDPAESNGAPDDGFGPYCENVAYYYPGSANPTDDQIAQTFYNLWYNSPPHKTCMFDQDSYGFNTAGVGIYQASNGYWWATFDSVKDASPPSSAPPPPPPPPTEQKWTRSEQNAGAVAYAGMWTRTPRAPSASGGSYIRSQAQGSTATFTFRGTGVRWIGIKVPQGGIANVRLDGLLMRTVDQYASTTSWQVVMFEKTGLTDTQHTLEISPRGTRNPNSRGIRTYVDAFERYP